MTAGAEIYIVHLQYQQPCGLEMHVRAIEHSAAIESVYCPEMVTSSARPGCIHINTESL